MEITDIPEDLRKNYHICLKKPDIKRLDELHELVKNFGPQHGFLRTLRPNTSRKYLEKATLRAVEKFEAGTDLIFHIFETQTDKMVGSTGIQPVRADIGYYRVGYWLGSDFIGLGYGREALEMVTKIALHTFSPNRLEIDTALSNEASKRIAFKCGYQLEAVVSNAINGADGKPDKLALFNYPLQDP